MAVEMTKQESFKARVRARMVTTGERYTEARRVLLAKAEAGGRHWIAQPELSDDAVKARTGKGWDEWCDLIDAWPGTIDGHKAIATYLRDSHDVDAWWAQGVTVGYERITGIRLPYQQADGTFTANKSRTVSGDADALRSMLLDADSRSDLFAGLSTELKSKPTSKAIRLAIGPGVAAVYIEDRTEGRAKITVAHEGLPHAESVDEWKFFWSDWLEAIGDATVSGDPV